MINWLKKKFIKKPQVIMIAAIQNDRGIGYQNNLKIQDSVVLDLVPEASKFAAEKYFEAFEQ